MIDEIIEKKLDQRAHEMGDYLAGKLEGLKRHGVIREVRGKGMLRGVELMRGDGKMSPFPRWAWR